MSLRGLRLAQAQSTGARKVVGVDIDDKLVRLAWKRRRYVWSLQEPASGSRRSGGDSDQAKPSGKRRNDHACDGETKDGNPGRLQAGYFPASFEHMFGTLPVPPIHVPGGPSNEEFPHNVTFRAADWVNAEIPEDKEGYDVVLA